MRWKLSEEFISYGDFEIFYNKTMNQLNELKQGLDNNRDYKIEQIEAVIEAYEHILQYINLRTYIDITDPINEKYECLKSKLKQQYTSCMQSIKAYLASPFFKDQTVYAKHYSTFFNQLENEKEHELSELDEMILAYMRELCIDRQYKYYTQVIMGIKATNEMNSKDLEVRKLARQDYFKQYQSIGLAYETIFNVMVRFYNKECQLRNYETYSSLKNSKIKIEDQTVIKIIEGVKKSYEIPQRYYAWKCQHYGLEKHSSAMSLQLDPLPLKYTYEEAQKTIIAAYGELQIKRIIEQLFENQQIDAECRKTKRAGAFCLCYGPKEKSYISMNFRGSLLDLKTLAHEIGHAFHKQLAGKQSYFNFDPPLIVSETMAMVSERIVMKYVEKNLPIKYKEALRRYEFEQLLLNIYSTCNLVSFEIEAHQQIGTNNFIKFEQLAELYKEEVRKLYPDSIVLEEGVAYLFAAYPHLINSPFYMVSYVIASLLAIYMEDLFETEDFFDKYKKLAEYGGKYSTEELFLKIGIDLKEEVFWKNLFKIIENKLNKIMEGEIESGL